MSLQSSKLPMLSAMNEEQVRLKIVSHTRARTDMCLKRRQSLIHYLLASTLTSQVDVVNDHEPRANSADEKTKGYDHSQTNRR